MCQAVRIKPKTHAFSGTKTGNTGSVSFYSVNLGNGELWIDWKDDGNADVTPFRFTGQELDAETGLYYFGARYLDPKISRWLSTDPALGEYVPTPGGDPSRLGGMGGVFNIVNLHAYHYSFNNPLRYTDPDGRMGSDEHRRRTLKIAWDLGISKIHAETIAEANVAVDSGRTDPVFGKQYPHFNTNNSPFFHILRNSSSGTSNDSRHIMARTFMEAAVEHDLITESLIAVGTGAHPVQDMPTHSDRYVSNFLGIRWTHFPFGMAADNPDKNKEGFAQADRDLREYIQEYIDRTGYETFRYHSPGDPNPWDIN